MAEMYKPIVAVVNGSNVVNSAIGQTGAFAIRCKVGDEVIMPDNFPYLIDEIVSNSQIKLHRTYTGVSNASVMIHCAVRSADWGLASETAVRLARIEEAQARGYTLQSASSLTIGSGVKVFTGVESGLNFLDGVRAAPPGHTQVFGAVKFDLNNKAVGQAFDRWTMVMGGSIVWVMDGEPGSAMDVGDNVGRFQYVGYHFRIQAGRVEIVRTVFLRDTPGTYSVLSHTITYKLRTGNWN